MVAVIVNGWIKVNGDAIGHVSQMKQIVSDGTVINIGYSRPNKIVIS